MSRTPVTPCAMKDGPARVPPSSPPRWTCMSHRPGMRNWLDTLMVSAPGGMIARTLSTAPTAAIRSPATTTDMPACAGAPLPSMTVTFSSRSADSVVGLPQPVNASRPRTTPAQPSGKPQNRGREDGTSQQWDNRLPFVHRNL